MARKAAEESVEIPLELPAPVLSAVALDSAAVVELWKTINALINDPQAGCNHKTRVETAQHSMPILTDALKQLGYGVHSGVLVPPGCTWDEKTGQLVYPEA